MSHTVRALMAATTLSLVAALGTLVANPTTVAPATTAPIAATGAQSPPASAAGVTLAAKKYKNCKALNKKYKHGVGKKGAKDKVKGKSKPVKNFTKNNSVYKRNKHLDRDKDGVACEKR